MFEVLPELASPNWRLQGDTFVVGYDHYATHLTLPPSKYPTQRQLPFAYLLAVAHWLNYEQSENLLKPQINSSVNLLSQVNNHITQTTGKHFLELFYSSSRLQSLTKFSYKLGQMWLHPIIDFSISPETVFLRLPASQLLENSKDQLLATTQLEKLPSIVIIASTDRDEKLPIDKYEITHGEYDITVDIYDAQNFPPPPAISYWHLSYRRLRLYARNVLTGGEIHAYMIHHFLNQRLVIPIPDLLLIVVAIFLGKGTVLILEKNSPLRRKTNILLLLFLLFSLNIIYGLASLQIYITGAILLPLFFPSLTFWVRIFFYLIKSK